jgi:hypothetical protein
VRRTRPDDVAHRAVISVNNPAIGLDCLGHTAHEFRRIVPRQVTPASVPVDGVELDMLQRQTRRDSSRQRGLARPGRADHDDPHL